MPIKTQGATATFDLDVRNNSGDFVDPSNLSFDFRDSLGTSVSGFPIGYPAAIVKDAVGRYHVDWTIPSNFPVGEYTALWTAILLGAPDTAQETWEIVPAGSMSTSGFDFLIKPDDYDAIRGLLGVTTLDVEDSNIELLPFAPRAEVEVKRRISNWAIQQTDPDQLFILRLATVYKTACIMAESFVLGGTIGLVRPLGHRGEVRDWASAAKQFCAGYEYWINIADLSDTEANDGADFKVDPIFVGGPTTHRLARRWGQRRFTTDPTVSGWWSFPYPYPPLPWR